ncbi:MAG: aspartyl protease family protein [Acidobacteria bacterium]|nr:aspartyl protease family protein [Acidobacteriota bacterium]
MFQKGEYEEAATIYREWVAAEPGSGAAHAGFARSLLFAGRPREATRALAAALQAAPNAAAVQVAVGDVAFYQAAFGQAEAAYTTAIQKDPKLTAAWLGLIRISQLASAHQSAERLLNQALENDPANRSLLSYKASLYPNDSRHLAALEKILASYEPDSEQAKELQAHIEWDKTKGVEKRRILVSLYQPAQIPIEPIRDRPPVRTLIEQPSGRMTQLVRDSPIVAWGVRVRVNEKRPLMLILETGVSGITVNSKAAVGFDLVRESRQDHKLGGIGGGTQITTRRELARMVEIGGVVFENFPIEVLEEGGLRADGLIGTDVFAQFLVTVDLGRLKLRLTPFPGMKTAPDPDELVQRRPSEAAAGFISFYRKDYLILLPTIVNDKGPFLFVISTGSLPTVVTPEVVAELGEVKNYYGRINATLEFAGLRQKKGAMPEIAVAGDMARLSGPAGPRIGGKLGADTLFRLPFTIDYRNGLIKFGKH